MLLFPENSAIKQRAPYGIASWNKNTLKHSKLRGGSNIFIGEGCRLWGAPFLPLKGRRFCLEGAVMGAFFEKAPFRHFCWQEGRRICLEGRRRGRKGRLFVSEWRIR